MAVFLSPLGGVAAQFFNNDGVPLAGGLIYTYAAGTNTPSATFTTGAGTISHTNPIVLDSAGRVPGGEIWLNDGVAYKFVIKDVSLTLIGTYDNIVGINSNFVNYSASQEIQTATAGQTVFTLTTMAYQPGTNSLSVFVDGVNQYGPGAQYAFTETSGTSVTFVSGLHVGAQVKFTTTIIQNVGAVDAEQVSYNPPFANAKPTNVEAKLAQTVSVADFGASPSATSANNSTYITAALNYAAANDAVLVFEPGTYNHNGITIAGGGFSLVGKNTRLNFTGSSSVDAFVVNSEAAYTYGFAVRGIEFINGYSCLKIVGVGTQIYVDIRIEDCYFKNSTSGGLWFEHCVNAIIDNNKFSDCGDNGIYYAFSRIAVISNNIVTNCRGSCGIVAGYVDTVITQCDKINIIGNVIQNDASATLGNYGGGIDVVYCQDVLIEGNVINNDASLGVGYRLKCGILIDEHLVNNVSVIGNNISNIPEVGIRVGIDVTTLRITNLNISSNKITNIGTDAITLQNAQSVSITGNTIQKVTKNGINADATCVNVNITGNTFIDIDLQEIYGAYYSIYSNAANTNIIANTFIDSQIGGTITNSAGGAATYSIDGSGVISFYSSGVLSHTVTTAGKTWSQVKTQIDATPYWVLNLYPGSGPLLVQNIRRTGYRWDANVQQYNVDTHMGTPEPYLYVYLDTNATKSSVLKNVYLTNTFSLPNNHSNPNLFNYQADTQRDLAPAGGDRQFSNSAIPTVGFYRVGDIVYNQAPTSGGYIGWVCTVAGSPGTWKTFGVIS